MDRELTENEKKKLFLKSYLRDKQAVRRIEEQLAELRLSKLSPGMSMGGVGAGADPKTV